MVTEPARILLGDVEVTRVQEYAGKGPATPGFLFPDSSPAYWADNAGWLDPDFYDAAKGTLRTVLHTWLIRSQGTIILLDTGAGNGKERPYAPAYAHHDTAYLDNLRAAGVSPEDVDIVINTHLHVDHVGWNTRLEGRDWVPTFPNARYLICEPDFLFWDPIRTPRPPGDGNQNVFEDSVQPAAAGRPHRPVGRPASHQLRAGAAGRARPHPRLVGAPAAVRRHRRPVRRRHPPLARADR